MTVELELTIDFRAGGNSQSYVAGGWALAEPDLTWMIGPESQIILRLDGKAEGYLLAVDVIPFQHPPELMSQRLIVLANDRVVGSSEVTRPGMLAYRIPQAVYAQSLRTVITLQHPDAARPSALMQSVDERNLAFSVSSVRVYRITGEIFRGAVALPHGLMLAGNQPRERGMPELDDMSQFAMHHTGQTLSQLAMQFESLGENCEFGLVQRRCDAEPLGLLRFSSTRLRDLIAGLETGFEGIGDPNDLEPRLEGSGPKEYMIYDKRFGLTYHTFVLEGQRSLWLLKEQESTRLKFLQRKFIEELQAAEKIFVYKGLSAVNDEEVLALFTALNRYGPNVLLWVVPHDADHAPGTVEVLADGLYRGYIDRFAPSDNAHDLSLQSWLHVCSNAYRLMRLQKTSPSAAAAPVLAEPVPAVAEPALAVVSQ
jgi:hypothetical protein